MTYYREYQRQAQREADTYKMRGKIRYTRRSKYLCDRCREYHEVVTGHFCTGFYCNSCKDEIEAVNDGQ